MLAHPLLRQSAEMTLTRVRFRGHRRLGEVLSAADANRDDPGCYRGDPRLGRRGEPGHERLCVVNGGLTKLNTPGGLRSSVPSPLERHQQPRERPPALSLRTSRNRNGWESRPGSGTRVAAADDHQVAQTTGRHPGTSFKNWQARGLR